MGQGAWRERGQRRVEDRVGARHEVKEGVFRMGSADDNTSDVCPLSSRPWDAPSRQRPSRYACPRDRREGGTTARVSMANPVETTGDPRGAPTFEKFGLPDSLSSHGTLAKLSPNLEFSTSNDDEYLDT